jgi:hypothetical protein
MRIGCVNCRVPALPSVEKGGKPKYSLEIKERHGLCNRKAVSAAEMV